MRRFFPLTATLFLFSTGVIGQTCSNTSLTAKYWQYRENLNKHFLKIDRKPEGCIGNGLTIKESDKDSIDCSTQLAHGLSLPATSIVQAKNGYDAIHFTGRGIYKNEQDPFFDELCVDFDSSGFIENTEVSWNEMRHNYLEFESETPHQLGWYLVVLATEYELLKRNEKYDQAQKTLEEIFLALQAYRRLDITANCLVKKRYDEITEQFEAETCGIPGELVFGTCLCSNRYDLTACPKDWQFHFDIPCKQYCHWHPNLSGHSGFYIREDATQELRNLHDPSDNKWNVDLVNSAFAMSLKPPCTSVYSQPCYLLSQGRFMSSDQIFSIMMGLAMVKRFVSETATVTTCEGVVYHPLEIAQNIAKGFVDLPENSTRHIFWPGSTDPHCCFKAVKLSECNGGNFQWLYAGIEYLYNYIDPEHNRDIGPLDKLKWTTTIATSTGVTLSNGNANYVLESMAFADDWDNLSNDRRRHLLNGADDREKEIFPLMNDVIYPIGPNNINTAEEKALYKQMLCDAPCEGPCRNPPVANSNGPWPSGYKCSNTPGWTGQRWEGPPHSSLDWDPTKVYAGRQFNGLDYMALHNLYLLRFPEDEAPFTDPTKFHDGDDHLLGEGQIIGPSFLCPYGSGTYSLANSYPASTLQSIQWKPSDHFDLSTVTGSPTTATFARPGAMGYPILNVDFNEVRSIPQWSAMHPGEPVSGWVLGQDTTSINDVCPMSFSKHIAYGNSPFSITTELDHCAQDYWFRASGPPANSFSWEITAVANNPALAPVTHIGNGQNFNLTHPHPSFPGTSGTLYISLSVSNPCGIFDSDISIPYECDNLGYSIRLDPNPATTHVAVTIVRSDLGTYTINDPNGMQVNIIPSTGTAGGLSSTIYTNGQSIPISTLPNGVYNVTTVPPGVGSPLNATLVILR